MNDNPERLRPTTDDAEFYRIVVPLGELAAKVVKDGFDPVPRTVPPELIGNFPTGHIAFHRTVDLSD